MTVAGADVVNLALSERGKPYEYGAEGPDAFDCSGLVQWVYGKLGLTTPRTTTDMMGNKSNLQPITRAQLGPGDLVFSNWTGEPHSHVGIYDGKGNIIEAPEPGKNVMVTKLGDGYWTRVDALRRVPGTDGAAAASDPSLIGVIGGALGGIAGMIAKPGNVTEALSNVGTGIAGVAEGAMSVGRLGDQIMKLFLPSNLIRGSALVAGTSLMLIGIWFLGREIKDS